MVGIILNLKAIIIISSDKTILSKALVYTTWILILAFIGMDNMKYDLNKHRGIVPKYLV